MGDANRNDFGIIRFREYKRWISPKAKRVGIITQPFDRGLLRWQDKGRAAVCKRAVYTLVDYLKGFLGNSTQISIWNSVNETLPLAYARMVMANQTFCSLSSFGIFPVIGTFGEGYFQQGNRGVNPFAQYLPSVLPNLHMMQAPVLRTMDIKKILRMRNGTEILMQNFTEE